MQRLLSLFFLLLIPFQTVQASCLTDQIITPQLLSLLSLMNIEHDGSLDSIVEETQKKWLRPSGKERWEIPEVGAENVDKVLELVSEIGFINEREPLYCFYDYCIILGATVGTMECRLNYAIKLWESHKLCFNHLIFLTGDRALDPQVEKILYEWKTETDAANYLLENLPSSIKENLISYGVLSVKMIEEGGKSRRPTTADTIDAFMNYLHDKGHGCEKSYLYVSNQPYCRYQDPIIRLHTPPNFCSETIGPEANKQLLKVSVILDTIARSLYAEREIIKKHT